KELLGILRFMPHPQWTILLQGSYLQRGEDINNVNYGGNIFRTNLTHFQDYNNRILQGNLSKLQTLAGKIIWQFRETDMFVEGETMYRKTESYTSLFIMLSLRVAISTKPYRF
ncbi:MAG: hypothetical protein NZ108_11250, partial [Bacteroidia bacterium]|nr:hypothetical protein [Bacteroidia bacterium]